MLEAHKVFLTKQYICGWHCSPQLPAQLGENRPEKELLWRSILRHNPLYFRLIFESIHLEALVVEV